MRARECPEFILRAIWPYGHLIVSLSSALPYSGNCECPSALYLQARHIHMTDRRCLGRYSNTLLVSLNNRISLHNWSRAQSGIKRSVGTHPSNTPRSEGTDIILVDMGKRPTTLKVYDFRMENTPQGSVIEESPRPLLPFSDAPQFRGFANIG
jgi:hypothetical protein